MYAKAESMYIFGISGTVITVEVSILSGWPGISIVGLPDNSIKEAKERILSAWKQLPIPFPHNKKIIVNLSPANIRKSGSHFDLAIFSALLQAVEGKQVIQALTIGEISLDGKILGVDRLVPIILESKRNGFSTVCLSGELREKIPHFSEINVLFLDTVLDLYDYIIGKGNREVEHIVPKKCTFIESSEVDGFSSIIGQETVKRALEIAASGRHNILLHGPPGTGKTQLAKLLPNILPDLTEQEIVDVVLMSSFDTNKDVAVQIQRPFRSPHHTASVPAIIGGGTNPRPGEISLAHHGILFLDEMPEFPTKVLEALRQPLEERTITISRIQGSAVFPANILLIATMNPCPCGYAGSKEKNCSCSAFEVERYKKRISGPILDRIDMHVHVPKVPVSSILNGSPSEDGKCIKKRVIDAAKRQLERNNGIFNSMLTSNSCGGLQIDDDAGTLAIKSIETLGLSMRGYYKLLKVARTIADLEGHTKIEVSDITEAMQYRMTI